MPFSKRLGKAWETLGDGPVGVWPIKVNHWNPEGSTGISWARDGRKWSEGSFALEMCAMKHAHMIENIGYNSYGWTSIKENPAISEFQGIPWEPGLMEGYCKYLAQRFGFPSVAAELLEVSEQIQY